MMTIQQEIGTWHINTFGREPMSATWLTNKWAEESIELLGALQKGVSTHADPAAIHDEMADCAILLLAMAHREGVELESLIRAKFEIVRNRDQVARGRERGL